MSETTPVSVLRDKMHLPEIKSEIFHGLIFLNFHDDPPPLAPSLAKLNDEFASYGLEKLIPGHVFPQESLKWNWKLHHENALEPYHTSYVHKGYHEAVPSNLTQFRDFEIGDGQVMRTTGFAKTTGDLFEESGNRRLPEIEGLSEEQRSRVLFVSIMPCAVAVLQPSFVTITFLSPVSAGVMNSRRVNLYSKPATEVPEFDRIRQEQFEHMKIIIMQDQVTQAALQEAYHSRYMPPGRLSYLENAITQLNTWVVDKYKRGLEAAECGVKADGSPLRRVRSALRIACHAKTVIGCCMFDLIVRGGTIVSSDRTHPRRHRRCRRDDQGGRPSRRDTRLLPPKSTRRTNSSFPVSSMPMSTYPDICCATGSMISAPPPPPPRSAA